MGVLIFLGLFFSGSAFSAAVSPVNQMDCLANPLYCAILSLQPEADKRWALQLSYELIKHSEKYQMDPWLSLAIAMKESSLRPRHRKNKTVVFYDDCKAGQCVKKYKIVYGYSDLSVYQIHVNTVEQMGLDPVRIHSDLAYATDAHFRILKQKLRQCRHLNNEAWSCYHTRTEHIRKPYVQKVKQYYRGSRLITNNFVDKAKLQLSPATSSIRTEKLGMGGKKLESLSNRRKIHSS